MAKYRRQNTPEDLEEQEELLRQQEAEKAKEEEEKDKEENKNLDPEELTFKKRYGDLRAHSQRVEQELRKQLQEKEKQLEEAAKSQLELKEVATPEDAKAWAQKYPEIAKIVRFIANEESKETSGKIEKDVEELNQLKQDIERRRAYTRLLELHPDFETISKDQKFHDWIESKGKDSWIYEALYYNDTDPEKAADAITLYKTQNPELKEKEKEEKSKKAKADKESAAETVTRKSNSQAPVDEDGKVIWSESYIEEMSKRDNKFFDKHEDEIMSAIQSGKFVYDITAGAH